MEKVGLGLRGTPVLNGKEFWEEIPTHAQSVLPTRPASSIGAGERELGLSPLGSTWTLRPTSYTPRFGESGVDSRLPILSQSQTE
jgi:hypothetical protein